jgi:hypothetical protein
MRNSIANLANNALARPSTSSLKRFLDELVNLPDEAAAARRFVLRFGDRFLTDVPQNVVTQWKLRIYEEDASDLSNEDFLWKEWLPSLRDAVRVLWKSSDYRSKQFGVIRILEDYFAIGGSRLSPGPVWGSMEWFFHSLGPATPVELALMRLLNVAHLTRFCANQECKTPYFWAGTASQRYCSELCAKPAQREYKRKWWTEHGNQWRRSRRAKSRNRTQTNSTQVPRRRRRKAETPEKKGGKHGTHKTR